MTGILVRPLVGAGRHRALPARGRPRHDRPQRGAARHRHRPAGLDLAAAVVRRRLPAGARGGDAAGRHARRPARPQGADGRRARRLRGRLALVRVRRQPGLADRRPLGPRPGRRGADPARHVGRGRPLRARGAAEGGAGAQPVHDGRAPAGPDRRRRAAAVVLVGVGLHHQRPGDRGSAGGRGAVPARGRGRAGEPGLRRARCRPGRDRPGGA